MKAILLTLSLTLFLCQVLRAEDSAHAEKIFRHLLTTQAAKDYDGFVADATHQLKAALTKTQFEALPRL